MKRLMVCVIAMSVLAVVATSALATPGYLKRFNAKYHTAGTRLNSCKVCHTSPPTLNPYGQAFAKSGFNFAAIERLDSDGDGISNIKEIRARRFPGIPNR